MLHRAIPFEELTTPLAELHRYWQDLPAKNAMPAWRDFDLSAIPPAILPSTMVIDIAPRIEDSIFRFWGSRMTQVHGRDHTGKSPYELQPPELGERILKDQRVVVETGKPTAGIYGFTSTRGFQEIQALLRLPMSDDGSRVSHMIVSIDISDTVISEMNRLGVIMQKAITRLRKDQAD